MIVTDVADRPDEVRASALSYLMPKVGDRAGIGTPEHAGSRWLVPVVLLPEGQQLGTLTFDSSGSLLPEESSTPDALAEAAERLGPLQAAAA